jgi:hypothetical protein
LFLRQFTCASVGDKKNSDNIKMHGMYVKKMLKKHLFCSIPANDQRLLLHGASAET